jgi:hypothetical protein
MAGATAVPEVRRWPFGAVRQVTSSDVQAAANDCLLLGARDDPPRSPFAHDVCCSSLLISCSGKSQLSLARAEDPAIVAGLTYVCNFGRIIPSTPAAKLPCQVYRRLVIGDGFSGNYNFIPDGQSRGLAVLAPVRRFLRTADRRLSLRLDDNRDAGL